MSPKAKRQIVFKSLDNPKAEPPLKSEVGDPLPIVGVASDDSQPNLSKKESKEEELLSTFTSDFQLTARFSVYLSRRQRSLLMEILEYQICKFGCNFQMWLALEMCMSSLLGQKLSWRELKDSNERRVCAVAFIILGCLSGKYMTLLDLTVLPADLREELFSKKLIMDSRVYYSRFNHWRPERFIEVCAVPLESLIERESGSTPYDSYCKGYGESHPSTHKQKVRPSAELDGETERPTQFTWEEINQFLNLEVLDLYRIGFKRRTDS